MPSPINFIWDAVNARYRSANGRYVAAAAVDDAVDKYLDGKANKADELFALLRDGRINVADLQRIGARELAKAHVAAGMAAKGGKAQMAQADYGRIGGYVKGELGHWKELMQEIADGRPLDGRVRQSLNNYFRAAANTYHRVQHLELQQRGYDQYKNVLNDMARHCESAARPSCPSVTARGYQPIGTLPERGQRACYWNCRCRWRYRKSSTGTVRN